VLGDIDRLGIEQVVVAGDLVGYGPEANEVVDLLITRGTTIIAGNHERDYVAPYADPATRDRWHGDRRLASLCWFLDRLGPERRAFLSSLPALATLDEATIVVHGSPRHVRDAVRATTPEGELEAMFVGEPARLAFVGHTHVPVVRDGARRRIVNVGSVGAPLDGDPRASFAIAEKLPDGSPGQWSVALRRVAFDVEAAIAAYGNGLREADPGFAEVMARQLRTGRPYLGPWLRLRASVPEEELADALRRFLAANP
jgi:diadenosine tetraphosphatase ApaH/serine/threonine PP2A family protein phosphatase